VNCTPVYLHHRCFLLCWLSNRVNETSLYSPGVTTAVASALSETRAGVGVVAVSLVGAGVVCCFLDAIVETCFLGGSHPGARETIIDIIFPSMMGERSITAVPFKTSAIQSSNLRPISGWRISAPRNFTLTLTLSPSARNSCILRVLTSTSCSSVRGLIRISFNVIVF